MNEKLTRVTLHLARATLTVRSMIRSLPLPVLKRSMIELITHDFRRSGHLSGMDSHNGSSDDEAIYQATDEEKRGAVVELERHRERLLNIVTNERRLAS